MGIALFSGNQQSLQALLAAADQALYEAKASGRGRYRMAS
ncbi:diguanylate cyclase domain-containing protein [Variovorax sp. N23]